MNTMRQYDVLKKFITSQNVKTLSKRDTADLLLVLYALYHDYNIVVTTSESISIPGCELIPHTHSHIDPEIYYPEIGRIFTEFNENPLLKHSDSKLTSEEYRDLVELLCSYLSYSSPESIYPKELSNLFQFFIKQSGCKSIYNPFAGMASIAISDEKLDASYIGQDIEIGNSNISLIRLDASGLSKTSEFYRENCFTSWRDEQAEAIVAMMPWGLKLVTKDFHQSQLPPEYYGLSYEEFFYRRACRSCIAKFVIGCSSASFCMSPRSLETREWLCKQRIVDTIIELPPVLLNTNLAPYIIVITPNEKHDYVRFVNAKSLFSVEKKRKFLDIDNLLRKLAPDDPSIVKYVRYEKMQETSCVFSYDFYESANSELRPNEQPKFIHELLAQDRGEICNPDEPLIEITPKDFSSEYIDVCSMPMPAVTQSREGRAYRKYFGPHLVLIPGGGNGVKMYWHREETAFCAHSNFLALQLSSKEVSVEYLIYVLLDYQRVKDFMSGSYALKLTWSVFKNIPIVINTNTEEQKRIVESAKTKALQERQAVIDATRARLNLQQTASDITHMLGTPWGNQAKIIRRLQKYRGDKNSPEYGENIEALISISYYINRIVKAMDVDSMTFDKEKVNLFNFLNSYIKMMKLCDMLDCHADMISTDDELLVDVDTTMLQVLMDSLFENARRHGFRKEVKESNQIFLVLSKVLFNEQPFALISVRNNGLPFPDGFTIKDYISKRRFSGKSGRTGLGGYHVYQITKKHGGFMTLRSDEEWNVIVDILLPLGDVESDNIYTPYDYETV